MRIDITRRARARAIIETGYWGSLVSGAFLLSITAWIDGQHLLSPRPFTREEILFHLSFLLSGGFLLSIPVGIRHKAFRLARYLGAMATTSVISASVLLFSQLGLSVVSNLGISSILALFALFPVCIIAGTLWYPREAAKPDVTNNKYHRKSLAGLIYSFLALILFVFILLSYKNMGSTWTAWFTRFYPSLFAWPLVSFLSRKGKQHRAMLARELIKRDDRTPILLLRSFSDDNFKVIPTFRLGPVPKTFEEAVAEELLAFGPITGIGKPGEQLPLLGAYREYVSYEDWQLRVRDLMSKAAAVIAIAGSTEGLLWEFDQIIALNLIHRVLLVFPPTKEAGEMMSFGKKTLRLEVDRKERWKAISQKVAPNLHVDTIPSDDEIENSLVAFFRDGACTLITGKGQSDMYYREALREAMYLVVDDDYSVRSSRAEKVIWTIGDLLNTLPLALLKPKSAITRAINSTPFWFAHLLLASLGLSQALGMCIALGLNPDIGLPLYALNIVADGIVLGLVFAYISTGLFKWTGSWLGGIGKYEDILTANAWACAPFLLQTVPITGSFFVFGEAMFAYPQNNTLILFITNSYLFTALRKIFRQARH